MKRTGKRITIAIAALLTVGQIIGQTNRTAELRLKAAEYKEQVEGDLKGAIEEYKKLADGKDRAVAARALISLGQCYEKIGQTDARKAYERVIRDFPEQAEVVVSAQAKLRAMDGAHVVTSPAGSLSARLVMSGPDLDSSSISPDGRWMATTRDERYVAVRNLLTGEVRTILDNRDSKEASGDYAEFPVFSPDLREIAYLWWNADHDQPEKALNLVRHNDRAQVRIIANEPRSKPRILVDNPEYQYFDLVGWSRDGRSILAKTWKKDITSEFAWISAADGKIRVIKSLEWKLRGRPNDAALSPDGKYLVYSAWANSPGPGPMRAAGSVAPISYIYVLAIDGSSETVLTQTAALNESPIWTPDGRHVLFISNSSSTFDLWATAIRDGKPEHDPFLVKRNIGRITPKVMTASGTYYYEDEQTDVEQVHIADLATGVTVSGPGSPAKQSMVGMNAAWSPDGKSIAFYRHSPGASGGFDLVLRDLQTQHETVYSRNGLLAGSPRWFHDGAGLLQLVRDAASAGWYFADSKTGNFKEIQNVGPAFPGAAALSVDDKTLYVVAKDPKDTTDFFDRIVAIDLTTHEEKIVTKFKGAPERLPRRNGVAIALSPDGHTLALATRNPVTPAQLALVDVDGSNYRELGMVQGISGFEWLGTLTGKLSWAPDGINIYFARLSNGNSNEWQLMRVSSNGGTPEPVGLNVTALSSFDVNPDGRHIAYSTTDNKREALHVIDNLASVLSSR